jgi:hypothetical protein
MKPLQAEDLLSLEQYSKQRADFRRAAIAHKRRRTLRLGAHLTMLFEDRLTVQYQVQEMLRIERIFEAEGIAEELAAYNPLIPDGSNWKATLLIEFTDEAERRQQLAQLRGIERHISVRVGDAPAVIAIADEDLERSNEDKTSAVHFLRFELTDAMVTAVLALAPVTFEVDHPQYRAQAAVDGDVRASLAADLAAPAATAATTI